jgi:hypothetical protein
MADYITTSQYNKIRSIILESYHCGENVAEIMVALADCGYDVSETFVETILQDFLEAELMHEDDSREDYHFGAWQG